MNVARNRFPVEIICTDLDAAQRLSADPRRGRGREAAHASRYRTLSFSVVYVCERDGELSSMAVNAYGGGDGGGGEGSGDGGGEGI